MNWMDTVTREALAKLHNVTRTTGRTGRRHEVPALTPIPCTQHHHRIQYQPKLLIKTKSYVKQAHRRGETGRRGSRERHPDRQEQGHTTSQHFPALHSTSQHFVLYSSPCVAPSPAAPLRSWYACLSGAPVLCWDNGVGWCRGLPCQAAGER